MMLQDNIAVLCARKRSIYKTHAECDVYDVERNAFTYAGNIPVIAHPPCRSWGKLSHFVKADIEVEKVLAGWCVTQVQRCGGVLEHPEYSRLWDAFNLPRPGQVADAHGGWTLGIDQWWWGHSGQKRTWLYIIGVCPGDVPEIPFKLKTYACKPVEVCSRLQREATPPAFASWLIELARLCRKESFIVS